MVCSEKAKRASWFTSEPVIFFLCLVSICWGLPGYRGLLALSFSLFYVICEFHYSYTEDEPS